MTKRAILVAGLGYGDEGKGSTVDYLTRRYEAHTVFRFNGGSQALHHVVSPDGTVHGFRQFGSGTFVPSAKTYLSRFMLVDPLYLLVECYELESAGISYSASRITADKRCAVITPYHKILGQMQEVSRRRKHSTCGMGVGEAVKDALRLGEETLVVGDLSDLATTQRKLRQLRFSKIDLAEQLIEENPVMKDVLNDYLAKLKFYEPGVLAGDYHDLSRHFKSGSQNEIDQLLSKDGTVIFEGAQGVLLDPRFGFQPFVTKTKTTFENAKEVLSQSGYSGEIIKLGVVRGYSTRHGNGPFVTEDELLTQLIPEQQNKNGEWQGRFRLGWLDLVAIKYSLDAIDGVDSIAVTNLDRLSIFEKIKVCNAYEYRGKLINSISELSRKCSDLTKALMGCRPVYEEVNGGLESYLNYLQERLGSKVSLVSGGPTYLDKTEIKPLF